MPIPLPAKDIFELLSALDAAIAHADATNASVAHVTALVRARSFVRVYMRDQLPALPVTFKTEDATC